jgi:hypothetical protein
LISDLDDRIDLDIVMTGLVSRGSFDTCL